MPKNSISLLKKFIKMQEIKEEKESKDRKKVFGIFLTNKLETIDNILEDIPDNELIFEKKFLEPACGYGIFILKIIEKAFRIKNDKNLISQFIGNNLFFCDINKDMIIETEKNIKLFFRDLFETDYLGNFNSFNEDFTKITFLKKKDNLGKYIGFFDFIIGNPPYVSLYGRRDKKINEKQRIYYLRNYNQFPKELKNGKINLVMLFLEKGIQFLSDNSELSFIIDITFFETAYKYCREYLLKNFYIKSIVINLQEFEKVGSGQIIIKILKSKCSNKTTRIFDKKTNKTLYIEQKKWINKNDEFKIRYSFSKEKDKIIDKINKKNFRTLKELYPRKNLRTCVMPLNMENQFLTKKPSGIYEFFPYYKGSKSLKYKYDKLNFDFLFEYNKPLQDKINNELKIQLQELGIKNKKRIGLGEPIIYRNPKVYIRQSAKELIASYDENSSAGNNSLYVFSLRNNNYESRLFLKYLTGILNSELYTFFAQRTGIIRYIKGKQPQIKISDLYKIPISTDSKLISVIAEQVDRIILKNEIQDSSSKINNFIYEEFNIKDSEKNIITKSISNYLK